MAKVLDAQVKSPQQTVPDELGQYELVGFGSGIDSGKHYKELLDFANNLPQVTNKKAFVFSTSGMPIGSSGQQRLARALTARYSCLVFEDSALELSQSSAQWHSILSCSPEP